MQAFRAASSPPACPLLRVGQWVARKSVGEGIGWAHSPFQASRALRRRGALRGPCILPPSTADERPKGSLRRAQGLGARTPLPHAAHSLSLECPSQRNRHPSPRLAAERAREAHKSTVLCFWAASSPPARPLLRLGQRVARKSVGEGIRWAHSPFQDSRALRRRAALRRVPGPAPRRRPPPAAAAAAAAAPPRRRRTRTRCRIRRLTCRRTRRAPLGARRLPTGTKATTRRALVLGCRLGLSIN